MTIQDENDAYADRQLVEQLRGIERAQTNSLGFVCGNAANRIDAIGAELESMDQLGWVRSYIGFVAGLILGGFIMWMWFS